MKYFARSEQVKAQIWRSIIRSKMRLSTECTQAMLVKKTQKLRCRPRSPANAPWRKSRIRTKPNQSHPPQSGQCQADLAHILSVHPKKSYPFPNQIFRSADQNRKHQLVKENLRDDRQFTEFTRFIVVSGLMQKIRRPARKETIVFVLQPATWGFGP